MWLYFTVSKIECIIAIIYSTSHSLWWYNKVVLSKNRRETTWIKNSILIWIFLKNAININKSVWPHLLLLWEVSAKIHSNDCDNKCSKLRFCCMGTLKYLK